MSNFLVGLGVGLVAGVLFAPKSGQDTREFIGSKANEGMDYLKRQSNELRETAMDAVDRGKDMVNRQVEKLAGSAQDQSAQVYQR
jgi:gas vesicle protein